MTFENLLESYALHRGREAAEKSWDEHGWGTHYVFAVHRMQGKDLVFECRTPDGLEMLDAVALAQTAQGVPAWIGDALNGLQEALDLPGVVVIGALRPSTPPENERPVVATLTVTFAEPEGPFDIEAYMPKDSRSTIKSQQDYAKLSDTMYRIHRISGESQGEGQEPLPVLLIEYVWLSKLGLVTMAFATTRMDMMGDKPRELFDQMRQTAYIGENRSLSS